MTGVQTCALPISDSKRYFMFDIYKENGRYFFKLNLGDNNMSIEIKKLKIYLVDKGKEFGLQCL